MPQRLLFKLLHYQYHWHCGGRSWIHPILCQSLIHVILITNLMFAQPQSNTDKPLLVTPIATDEPRQRVHISSDDRGGLKIGQQAMVTIAQNYWFNLFSNVPQSGCCESLLSITLITPFLLSDILLIMRSCLVFLACQLTADANYYHSNSYLDQPGNHVHIPTLPFTYMWIC